MKMPESFCIKNSLRMKGNKIRLGTKQPKSFKEAKKISWTGENNPNWKGGISRGYKSKYYTAEYKQWRRDIFIRDEYTCQDCGRKDIYVTAHHIKSFAHYPELRFAIDNGKTLCENCHKKTDNYKGRAKHKGDD